MSRRGFPLIGLLSLGLAVLAGLAQAQPNDPIGDILQKAPPGPAAKEEAPPAPGQVPAVVAPTAPPPQSAAKVAPDVDAPKPATPSVAAAKPAAPAVIEPPKRPRYPVAILQALDKVTAESIRFEAPVGQPVKYHNLVFTVRSCETTTPEEKERDAIAFVEVDSRAPAARGGVSTKSVFKGWFFAASPSVNPLQHPVYDAWLIACRA